ncbi:MAG: hypothetical protein IKZ43_07360 [Acidaminococcaceae bacterium]|nr:hypothetical protein [Acidaminococcaceae bacterium]
MDKTTLRWLMTTREGREAMLGVLDLTGVYRTDFSDGENTNMLLTGRRSVGTDLLQEIRSLEREDGEDGLSLEYRMLREDQERQRRAVEKEKEDFDFYKE